MNSIWVSLLSLLLICVLVFICHGLVTRLLYIEVNGYKPTGLNLLTCFTPILNLKYIRVLLYGEAKVYNVLCNILFYYFVIVLPLRVLLPVSSTFTMFFTQITALTNLLAVAICYVLAAHCTSDLCKYYNGKSSVVWSLICPPFGALLAYNLIQHYTDDVGTDYGTFNDFDS